MLGIAKDYKNREIDKPNVADRERRNSRQLIKYRAIPTSPKCEVNEMSAWKKSRSVVRTNRMDSQERWMCVRVYFFKLKQNTIDNNYVKQDS